MNNLTTNGGVNGGITVGKKLSYAVIFTLLLQFASIVWFASNLNSRICYIETWMQKNEAAINSLDVIQFRQQKIADLLEKVRESQQRLEVSLEKHMAIVPNFYDKKK